MESSKKSELKTDQHLHRVTKRLEQELLALVKDETKQPFSAFPKDDNIFNWLATIEGPPDTVYSGQKYRLSLKFPETYPFEPPSVQFITKCFHPNVSICGLICLDILQDKWSAIFGVRTILLSIQLLLGDPNIEDPLNVQAAQQWSNQKQYKMKVDEIYANNKNTD